MNINEHRNVAKQITHLLLSFGSIILINFEHKKIVQFFGEYDSLDSVSKVANRKNDSFFLPNA